MKTISTVILALLLAVPVWAEEESIPSLSNSCVIRTEPGGRDGSTVEYTWKVTATAKEERVMSVVQLRRSVLKNLGKDPWILGSEKVLWCDPNSTRTESITLEVDQAPDDGERAYWFEGFLVQVNEDTALPESATVSVTTRQIEDEDPGQLIDILVADQRGREISRHFIFIRYANTAEYPDFAKEASIDPKKGWKTTVWQDFMDPPVVKRAFRRFEQLQEADSKD